MMNKLATNLSGAWGDRAARAEQILREAAAAPALFKPDHVADVQAERDKAISWARFWALESLR